MVYLSVWNATMTRDLEVERHLQIRGGNGDFIIEILVVMALNLIQ